MPHHRLHNLSPANACVPDLFSEVWDGMEKKLTLDKVVTAKAPTLDMYNDDAFYSLRSKLKPYIYRLYIQCGQKHNKLPNKPNPKTNRKVRSMLIFMYKHNIELPKWY